MAIDLDTILVLVPATWEVPGAGSIPTTRNKDFFEGRLVPETAAIDGLVTAGMKLPGALFEAEGRDVAGSRIGVRVGLYDLGGGDPIALVEDAVARLTPEAALSPTTVCGQDAVRTFLRRSDRQGDAATCDYWGPLQKDPGTLLLLRFWRMGPAKTRRNSSTTWPGPCSSGAARIGPVPYAC